MFSLILLDIRGFLEKITNHKIFNSPTFKVTNIETVFCKGHCLDIDVSVLFRITKQWCVGAGLVSLAVHVSPQWCRPDHAGAPMWFHLNSCRNSIHKNFQNITWTELHFTMKNKEQFLKIISKYQGKQKTDAQRLWWDLETSAAPLDKYVDWEQMKDQRNRRWPERTDGCTRCLRMRTPARRSR